MAEQLAKVLGDVEGRRGPDVVHRVVVPKAWFAERATITVTLPRNLACAACSGGGCDACDRAGAISLRARDSEAEVVTLPLSAAGSAEADVCLRLVDRGGWSAEEGLPRGHLLLVLRPGEQPSADVRRDESATGLEPRIADPALMVRIVVGAVLLFALFLVMLRLSGWL